MEISKIKKAGIPLLSVILVSVFPVLFLYFTNAGEADFSEVVRPLLIFGVIGIVVFFITYLLVKSADKAALISSIFMLIMTNFSILEKGLKIIFSSLRYWHTVPIFLVMFVCLAVLIVYFLPKEFDFNVSAIICVVLGVLIVINGAFAIPKIADKMKANQLMEAQKEQLLESATKTEENQPNVYYLIFDEYAGFKQMETYYQYDNAVLRDYLEKNNFTISYDSHNESIMTTTITTNLMNLDYAVNNYMSNAEKEPIRKNGALFQIMRDHGYKVDILETIAFFGDEPFGGQAGSTEALTASGENLEYLCYQNTIIYPFYRLDTASALKEVLSLADYLSQKENLPDEPTFTLVYFCFPHTPFLVDENGNQISPMQYVNWHDDSYYLGQYKYCTKLMIKILDNILQSDPDSIIIMQSDHGARASTDLSIFMEKFPLESMNNPLNTVYFKGEDMQEIEGLSGVNTLRTVFSKLWNEEYPVLEVPEDTYDYLGKGEAD